MPMTLPNAQNALKLRFDINIVSNQELFFQIGSHFGKIIEQI
tara:strand:- start:78 stop:203 length:126 start_codon:yes stop_codon:yes gene_type:complete